MRFHDEPLSREELIRKYLSRRLDEGTVEAFESHYLSCDECFEELRATELLVFGLGKARVGCRRLQDVVVFQFNTPVQLTRQSKEMRQLLQGVLEQKDTKVLIDLGRVSRIDSAGLGLLMSCYSHAIRNRGMLKLLNPSQSVQNLLRLTRIDTVVETFYDESQAVQSFAARSS